MCVPRTSVCVCVEPYVVMMWQGKLASHALVIAPQGLEITYFLSAFLNQFNQCTGMVYIKLKLRRGDRNETQMIESGSSIPGGQTKGRRQMVTPLYTMHKWIIVYTCLYNVM